MTWFLLSSFSLIHRKKSEQKEKQIGMKNVEFGEEKNVSVLKFVVGAGTEKAKDKSSYNC